MFRSLLKAALCAFVCLAAQAQMVTVTGTHITDASGNPVWGRIYFSPNTPFRLSTGGQIISYPVVATVTNGTFSMQLADTTQTIPANVCYNVYATNGRQTVLGSSLAGDSPYRCVQTTGSSCAAGTCNFDNYTSPFGSAGTTPTLPDAIDLSTSNVPGGVKNILPKTSGGTGTATPGLQAGPNISIGGTWPNQTITGTGGGGAVNLPITTSILKGDGAGGAVAATAGTDYQAPLGFTPEQLSHKGAANGYAPLGADSKVPSANLPTIPTATSQLTNDSGFLTCITSSNVTTALGYTPENPANKGAANGYAPLVSGKVPSANVPQINLGTGVTGSLPAASVATHLLPVIVIGSHLPSSSRSHLTAAGSKLAWRKDRGEMFMPQSVHIGGVRNEKPRHPDAICVPRLRVPAILNCASGIDFVARL